MASRKSVSAWVFAAVVGSVAGGSLRGAVVGSGDLLPGDPTSWTASTEVTIGNTFNGNVTVSGGGSLVSGNAYLGRNAGSTGVVSVDGAGSAWYPNAMFVGEAGSGVLNITNGGVVYSDAAAGYIGHQRGSTGVVTVDGAGSTWTQGVFYVGTYVGSSGSGTLNITHGGEVSCDIGPLPSSLESWVGVGSTGVVTVDGPGSALANRHLLLGETTGGTGVMEITHGGIVSSNGYVTIGALNGTGVARVDGTGSMWTIASGLAVGSGGVARVDITGGGEVTALATMVSAGSQLRMSVGDGSLLTSSGTLKGIITVTGISNNGLIRLRAAPNATAGTYTPISAVAWSGIGVVQALGGKWNSAAHSFTVVEAATGNAGQNVLLDRSQTQRVMVTDSIGGGSVEADFQAGLSSVTVSAEPLTAGQTGLLVDDLAGGVLAGWTFTADGYAAGEPVGLSMSVGAGYSVDDLSVWHFDGASWTPYGADDLAYDGMNVSFTVTGFSGYAVVVPEPGVLGVMMVGAGVVLARRRRGVRRGGR